MLSVPPHANVTAFKRLLHVRARLSPSGDASGCVDYFRSTHCSGPALGVRHELSIQLPAGRAIHSVALFLVHPPEGHGLAPFEVWAGSSYSRAELCGAPVAAEPSHEGRPFFADCGGAVRDYLLLKQVEPISRLLWLNEVVVFTPAPPPAPPTALSSIRAGARPGLVARAINKRYRSGGPSDTVAGAGVLLHFFENGAAGSVLDSSFSPDKLSASLISKAAPLHYHGTYGVIIRPSTPLTCIFPHDSGSGGRGGKKLGGCPGSRHLSGADLRAVLQMQYYGSNHSREAGRGPHRVATYNEVIINRLDWELGLPRAVEAFVFVLRRARYSFLGADRRAGDPATARRIHRRFLRDYSLRAADVPLLRHEPRTGFVELDTTEN